MRALYPNGKEKGSSRRHAMIWHVFKAGKGCSIAKTAIGKGTHEAILYLQPISPTSMESCSALVDIIMIDLPNQIFWIHKFFIISFPVILTV